MVSWAPDLGSIGGETLKSTVFFDLDGTLTDPRPGIVRSIQHALVVLDQPVPAEADLLWCIGPPLRASFITLLGGEDQADAAVASYRERFADVGLYENRVYAGIQEVLQHLREQDRELHVATSKPHVYAERIVEHFGLRDYFGRVFGSELSGERTDKTDLLSYAITEAGCRPGSTLMIGDRSHDIVGARNNGIDGIGVLYGYGSREELEAAGAVSIVARTSELRGVLVTDDQEIPG